MTRGSALTLVASASLPNVACLGSGAGAATDRMTFRWAETTGQYTGPTKGTSKNPRALALPANALQAGATYTFRVLGYMTDTPNLNNTAEVVVAVGSQALVASIAGGAFRQAGAASALVLDGSASSDPDQSAVPMTYRWACADASGAACVDATGGTCGTGAGHPACPVLALAAEAKTTVSAGALAVGKYTVSLTVAKGSTRTSTASATVQACV